MMRSLACSAAPSSHRLQSHPKEDSMKRLLVIALFSLLLPCLTLMYANEKKEKRNSAARGGNVEQEIKSLQEQGRDAALKGDTSFQEKHLVDDYVGIDADGRMLTKDEAIQRRKSGAVKYESIDQREAKIRVYGDTAVLNSLASVKGTSDGKPFSGSFRTTFVYVKQKGDWKQVSFQTTQVTAEAK
jgi:ketosteroid isomerase-like protein